jgi:hypothetical protein
MMKARSEAQRRYLKRTIAVTALYLATVAAASFFIDRDDPVTAITIILAILPGLAIMGIFWAIARLMVEEQDEFIRMLIVRQSLIATGLALSVASVWGFLEAYGVAPHIDSYWVAILWFFGLGVGAVVNKLQYGTYGECW